MNWQKITALSCISAIAIVGIALAAKTVQAQSEVQFVCGQSYDRASGQRYLTTYARNKRGKIALIRWSQEFKSYTSEQRCEAVSSRFQEAYDNGSLKYITNSTMNGHPVICTTSEFGGSCQTLLMTMRSREKAIAILNQLNDTLDCRFVRSVPHSSNTSQLYCQLDIEQFLETAPVEEED